LAIQKDTFGVGATFIHFRNYQLMSEMASSHFLSRLPTALVLMMLFSIILPFANPVTPSDEGMTEAQLKALQQGGFTSRTSSDEPEWSWAVTAGGWNTYGYEITSDSVGDVYVTGRSPTASISGNTIPNAGLFIAKLKSNGTWSWVVGATGTGAGYGRGIALDSGGNSIITGYFTGTLTFGSTSLTSSGGKDIFVAKLSSNQTWLWAKSVGSSGDDHGYSLDIDTNGNSFLTGDFTNSITFGSTTSLSSVGTTDMFVAKIDSNGTWLWSNSAGSTREDQGLGIVVDSNGSAYVTGGSFLYTITFGTLPGLSNSGYADMFVAKISSTGTWQWAKTANGASDEIGYGIAVDSSGYVYLTGYYRDTITFGNLPSLNDSTSTPGSGGGQVSNGDLFVVKISSSGVWQWATGITATGPSWGYGITVDSSNNAYVTGGFQGPGSFGNTTLTSNGGKDVFVAKLAESGAWSWAKLVGNTTDEQGYGISVDMSGSAYITGSLSGTGVFNNSTLSSGNFVAKLEGIAELWIDSIGPENGTAAGGTNITLTGGGFDTLPQYRREITVTNPYNTTVENITFDVVDPIYNETGLIASYHLDESSGTIADSSGNDYYGTTYGNSVYGVDGKVGAAMEFDGTNNNRVELQQSLNPSSISLSAWVNPSSPQNQIIVGSDAGYYLALRANGTIEWHWWTSTSHYLYGSATVPTGVWSHITASYDDTSGASVVYLDGQIYSQTSISPAALKNQSGKLGIGDCDSCTYSTFDGVIDEVRVYERALTSTEVSALSDGRSRLDYGDVHFWAANGSSLDHEMLNDGHFRILIPSMTAGETRTLNITYGAAGLDASSTAVGRYQADTDISFSSTPLVNDENLTGWWRLDETSGTTSYDHSGNGNHGIVAGSPTMGQQGKVGSAIEFDRSNDEIVIPNDSDMWGSSLSTIIWVRFTSFSYTQTFFEAWGTGSDSGVSMYLFTPGPGATFYFEIRTSGATNPCGITINTTGFESGQWIQFAQTFDGSTQRAYMNGVEVGNNSCSGTFTEPSDDLNLGSSSASCNCGNRYFGGLMDEVSLYNRALTSSEIGAKYNETVGPIAHWKMDDSSSSIIDASGNGHDGNAAGSPNYNVDGQIDDALRFDGTNDYIRIPDSPSLRPTEAMSVAAWVRVDSWVQTARIIDAMPNSSSRDGYRLLITSTGAFEFHIDTTSTASYHVAASSSGYAVDRWNLVVGTYDGSKARIFVNGVEEGSTSATGTIDTGGGDVFIGARSTGGATGHGGYMFDGFIDDARIYDHALGTTDIDALYSGADGGLVGHWKLEENNPMSSGFIDSTGNGWDGQCYSSCPSRVTGMDGYGQSHSGGGGHGLNTSLILDGAKGATLSTWFKLSTLSGDGAFISSIYGSHSQIGLGYDDASTDVFKFTLEDVSGGIQSVNCDASACAPVTGEWHHLAVSLKSNSVEWYYDGQLVENDSVTFSELEAQSVNRIRIAGRFDQNINDYYSGSLDDARVYDRGLSVEQVSDMYDSYSSGAHPILHLQMDERAGILADSSGNRNDGIPFNGPTLGENGTVMKGVDFDGVNDHIIVGSSAIDAIVDSGEMTASAWVRIDSSVSGNPHILSGGKGNSYFGSLIGLSVATNGTARFYTPSSTINYPEIWSATTIDDDKWHHVTATLDATTISSTVIRIYIDGTLEATMSGFYWDSNQTSTTYLDELVIGTTNQLSPSSQYFLDGRLDEVKLHDHALTASAISDLRDDTSPPIAHWKLDETSGTIIDSSGNGYNGTATGSPTYGVEGALGTALDFDGSNDHIAISSPPDWYSGDSFTWLLWVKMDDVSSDQMFIQHGTAEGGSGNGAYLNYWQNKVMFTSPLNSGQGVMSPTYSITQGMWTHLALVVDINGNTSLFIDGVDVSQNAYNGDLTAISTPSGSMHIGEDVHRSVQNLDGGVDDVRIFGRALSTEEIEAYYQETTVLHPTAHWKLDDISGTIVDSSGNGHNGTASGGPTYGAEGVLGTALGFDGSNDYIDLNYYINTLPSGGMSYCMWAKNTLPTLTNAVAIWGTDGSHEWRIIIQTNGSIGTYIRGTGGSVGVAAGNLGVGVWHHICSVYDDDSSALNLYVDGSLAASTAVNLSGFNQGVDQFLGCMDQSGSCRSDYDKFKGVIDDVFLYEGALSASSILDYYQEVINSSVSPLGSVGTETSIPLSLTFGGASATNVTLVNGTTINATAPAAPGGIAGMANVTLTGWNGMSTTLVNGFEYLVPDLDGDGWDDDDDAFPNDYTQWNDTDSDGYGDNWEDGAWNASRNGTQGQWLLNATTPDGCPVTSGNSSLGGWWGCIDTDGDGWADLLDDFSNDSTQWNDTDGDGWGDNLSGNNPDQFINDSTQWNDTDNDGFGDNWGNATLNATRNGTVGNWVDNATLVDKFPTYESAAIDTDNDGHPDNWTFLATISNGESQDGLRLDACPLIWGNSSIDRSACPDADGDGRSNPDEPAWTWLDGADNFTSNPTQWSDADADGFGDNWQNGSWNSTREGDGGIGDWVENATEVDWCPDVWGNSSNERLGCLDRDGDGLADVDDDFPDDSLRGGDSDGDGYDDAIDDDCPLQHGNSTIDRVGCPDGDGDGHSDDNDAFPSEPSQWSDFDGDGYGDSPLGVMPDACVNQTAYSSEDRYGCIDSDGDGWSDADSGNWSVAQGADALPSNPTQWNDTDGDGWGDNWADGTWNASRNGTVGQWVEGATEVDRFPSATTQWVDDDGDGWGDNQNGSLADAFLNDSTQWRDSDGDGFGDNWANSVLNASRNVSWPGIWMEGATTPDECPLEAGNSSADRLGCPDRDGDGWSDDNDDFPDEAEKTLDGDEDGFDDGWEDDCIGTYGTSFVDRIGCPDSDGDGISDPELNWTYEPVACVTNGTHCADAFPADVNQSRDRDLDGYGENRLVNVSDDCLSEWGNSTLDRYGCPDRDGDGWSDEGDDFPDDSLRRLDADGDGYEDFYDDDCPELYGTSTENRRTGCPDSDGDGWADEDDTFPNESTQWADSDHDGWGDNFATNAAWPEGRDLAWPGRLVTGARLADLCPVQPADQSSRDGCPTAISAEPPAEEGSLGERIGGAIASGDFASLADEPVVRTFGLTALLIAFLTFLQTNLVTQFLPESLRFLQLSRRKNKLSDEEVTELHNIQSLVRLGADEEDNLREDLTSLRSELSGKEVQGDLPKGAADRLGSLINRILAMPQGTIHAISDDSQFFGLSISMAADERLDEARMERDFNSDGDRSRKSRGEAFAGLDNAAEELGEKKNKKSRSSTSGPLESMTGITRDDGYEYIEWPEDSSLWYYRVPETDEWKPWKG
jgi:hypothetical protein